MSGAGGDVRPWRAAQLAQELEADRLVVTAFPQTDARMIPASDRLYRAVVERRLTVPDDDELRVQVGNTIARHCGEAGASTSRTTRSSPSAWRSRRSRTSPPRCRWAGGYDPLPRLRHPYRRLALRRLHAPEGRLEHAA